MSRITPVSAKKRKLEEAMRGKTSGKPRKRIRKQKHYHSSSSEDNEDQDVGFAPVSLDDSDEEAPAPKSKKQKKSVKNTEPISSMKRPSKKPARLPEVQDAPAGSGGEEQQEVEQRTEVQENTTFGETPVESSDSNSGSDSASASGSESNAEADVHTTSAKPSKTKSKRNDPTAFSTSISKILSTKLPTSVRHDPVLSRSVDASKSRQEASNERLEVKARAKLRADKQVALQKGRTTDVLGIERGIAGDVAEKEKGLRKIAQRGVIQLFNAFRAAHVKAEEARKEERRKGTVGMGERDRKVNEVSKEGFLELIGGKKKATNTTANEL